MASAVSAVRDRAAEPGYLTTDGRRLAYTTYGDPTGRPLLFCHGTPGSRLLGRLLDAPVTKRGVCLIAPDRPGIGDSDDAPVGIDDWPDDAAALLAQPWPVDLGDVSVPVTLFQGQRDTNVAPETGEALARRLPEATLERVGSDHLGTLCVAAGRALRGPTPV